MKPCDIAASTTSQTCLHLASAPSPPYPLVVVAIHQPALIASPIHRHLTLPRPSRPSSIPKTLGSPTFRLKNNNARTASPVEPHTAEHAVPLHSFLFLYVSALLLCRSKSPLFLLSFLPSLSFLLSPSYLADGPSMNAVYALTSRPQSCPRYCTPLASPQI